MRKKGAPERFTGPPGTKPVVETCLTDLPLEITTKILLSLPLKSILKCKCVCRSLRSLISSPIFTNLHFKNAQPSVLTRTNNLRYLNLLAEPERFGNVGDGEQEQICDCYAGFYYPGCTKHKKLDPKLELPFQQRNYGLLNSCNGFLCLCEPQEWSMSPLAVCNPVTGDFITLPDPYRTDNGGHGTRVYAGFGFQPKTNEYKVLRILKKSVRGTRIYRSHKGMVVQVHTLGTSTWKNVDVDPSLFITRLRFPTCVNGVLHWIVSHKTKGSIVCFNFESESFESLPSPPDVFKKDGITDTDRISMAELGGFLYMCDSSSIESLVMWVMKEYGIEESWTKVFSIDTRGALAGLCWPVKHFEKVDAILMYHSCNYFIYCEPKRSVLKFFWVHGALSEFEVIPHIPSLISLEDFVKEDDVEVLNVHSW